LALIFYGFFIFFLALLFKKPLKEKGKACKMQALGF